MARQQQLLRLAQQVAAATAAADWKELGALDAQLAAILPVLAAQGIWTAGERSALVALRQQHRDAMQKVRAANCELGKQLQQMNTHKEGWLAYALDNDFAGTNS
ncbi:hypothetical protein [Massilia sp. METH4]|uniref:hypothetical protein n=1 Tax=Massilia sp. METH4 TaxID=3123041 RepID=UPI0030CB5F4B